MKQDRAIIAVGLSDAAWLRSRAFRSDTLLSAKVELIETAKLTLERARMWRLTSSHYLP